MNAFGQRLAVTWKQTLETLCWLICGHNYTCSLQGCRCKYCGKEKQKALQ